MPAVTIKWNKQQFKDIELDTAAPVSAFKKKLQELTGVPVERQKLMAKGAWKGILGDNMDLSTCTIKPNQAIMLMGSAEVVTKPAEKVVFVEDMKEEDLVKTGTVLPAGFVNLGNTCYMNSTLQCLRKVPELRQGLKTFDSSRATATASNPAAPMLTAALGTTLDSLDKSTDALPPVHFVNTLRQMYPQFAQQGPRGGYMQQDAEELYSSVTTTLSQCLKMLPPGGSSISDGDEVIYTDATGKSSRATVMKVHREAGEPYYTISLGPKDAKDKKEKQTDAAHLKKADALTELGQASNLIDALFGVEMEEELKCTECDDEPVVKRTDLQRRLVCNIQGGAGALEQINHLHEGIKLGLTGSVEKNSDVLGRNAVWSKNRRIKRLPRYICMQYMRFFWKATPNSRDHAGVKCKIMKPVSLPKTIDMYEFCTDELQEILKIPRAKLEQEILGEEKLKAEKVAAAAAATTAAVEAKKNGEGEQEAKGDAMEVEPEPAAAVAEDDDDDEEMKAALALSMGDGNSTPMPEDNAAGPGLPGDFKGNYELFAVVTHKGREADGGHYMGWVRQEGDNWLVFDDADVSPCKTEEIMNLKGGGDWHMAYLTYYRWKD